MLGNFNASLYGRRNLRANAIQLFLVIHEIEARSCRQGFQLLGALHEFLLAARSWKLIRDNALAEEVDCD